MMGDMTTLAETIRENLHDVESEISFVKKVVTGSAHSADVSLNRNPLVVHGVPKS